MQTPHLEHSLSLKLRAGDGHLDTGLACLKDGIPLYSRIHNGWHGYHVGLSNSGWRGNFAELFSHPKIFVVTKLSCRIRDNYSISLIFTRYGILIFYFLT